MHELGLRYPQGISLLLSSAVPEGKGVSSSAAVEVAVMQALCAAHHLQIHGRHLALLCQKVTSYCLMTQVHVTLLLDRLLLATKAPMMMLKGMECCVLSWCNMYTLASHT